MGTEVDRGRGGVDIDGRIASYLRDPKKNKSDKTKALNSIESQVKSVGERIVSLQSELEQSYMKMQMGDGGLDSGRVKEIEGEIAALKKNLSTLNVQLAKLAKYKKSQKLADRVLASSIALSEVESEIQLIKEAEDNGIPKAAQLRREINSILDEASKKTNRKQSGEILEKAISKYEDLKKERDQFATNSVEYRQINADMRAIRVRMTVIVDKRAKLSKSEKKFLDTYHSGKRTTKKDEKWRLVKARSDVIIRFSRESSSTLREQPKGVSSWGDDDFSLTSSPVSRRKDGETVESRLSSHRLSKREKLRTKVSVTPWQKIRHGELVTIARSVHEIGKQQMRTLAVLSQAQSKYQSGEYSSIQLRDDLAEVKSMIADTEAQLAGLQAEAAAKGSSKLSKKVEKAIVANRSILASLRAKEADLQTITNDNYAEASKQLQVVRDQVSHAIENPKEAGPAMFKAYEALGVFEALSIPSPGPDGVSRVDQEIADMQQVAQALIASAKSEGVLSLTKTEHNFLIDLLNGAETGLEVKNTDKNYERLVSILSKKFTLAKHGKTDEQVEAQREIAIILKYLSAENPELLGKLRTNPELSSLFSMNDKDHLFKQAANYHHEALQALAEAKAEPKRAPYHVNAALEQLAKIEELQTQSHIEKHTILAFISGLESQIKESSGKSLVLSSHKKGVRTRLLEGKVKGFQRVQPSKRELATVVRVRQVLANEMLRVIIGHESVVSKELAQEMQEQLGNKKGKMATSSIEDLLDKLENNPGLKSEVMKDPEFVKIYQMYRVRSAEGQLTQLKSIFVQWSKYKRQQKQIQNGQLTVTPKVQEGIDKVVQQNEPLLRSALQEVNQLIEKMEKGSGEQSERLVQLKKMAAEINKFLEGTRPIEEAEEYAVQFRTILDDIGTAEAVTVQSLNSDILRKPPPETAVNNLLKELTRLQNRDVANMGQWQEMVRQVRNLNQFYQQNVGEAFKDLYHSPIAGEHEVNPKAQLTPRQVQLLAELKQKHEAFLSAVNGIQFTDSEFSQLHIAYPAQLENAIRQRGRALAALEALAGERGTVTEPAQTPVASPTVATPTPRTGLPPPITRTTAPTPATVPVSQQTARLYQQAFNVRQIVGSPYPNMVKALRDEISRRSDADPANKEQWGVMLNAVNEFAKVYKEVGTMYEGLYDEHGALRQDVSLTPTQASFVDWMANQIHPWLTGQIDAVKFRPTDQTQVQQAHIQGFNNMLAGFKQSVDALNRLPRAS